MAPLRRNIMAKPKRPLWDPPEHRVNVVNIDPSSWVLSPKKKTSPSKVQRLKDWFVGKEGILRKDLLAGAKSRFRK